jgi:hypothetical protein
VRTRMLGGVGRGPGNGSPYPISVALADSGIGQSDHSIVA